MTSTTNTTHTIALWQEGEVSDHAAQKALLSDYWSLAKRKAEIEAQIDDLRRVLEHITFRTGKTTIAGLGTLEIAPATFVKGYDRKALDELIVQLSGDYPQIVQQLLECRTEAPRKGGLKVSREKA